MVSRMIFGRPDTGNNYTNWHMSSVASWGEFSAGDWTLTAWDRTANGDTGTFNSWQIIVWGYESGVEPTETPTGGPETETPTPTDTNTPGGPTETPTDTNTPGGPTETPTDEATPTATATDEPGTTELIDNGDFENLDGDGKPDVTPWVVKNSSGDKAKCNKDKDGDGVPDKIFANTGNCAFTFKGVAGDAGKLEQTIDLTGVTLGVGDALNLTFSAQTKAGSTGKAKSVFKYGDGTKTKITVDITDTSDVYAAFAGSGNLTSTDVTKSKINFKMTTETGKLYVDGVSLKHVVGTAPTETPAARLGNTSSQSLSGSK
jgi:hypothetical protein